MFTGIIEALGKVESKEKRPSGLRLRIGSGIFSDQKAGGSISVNGVCLTIAELKKDSADFDVIGETLDKSNLGLLKNREAVNLERALRAQDRIAGHFVTGHIDCTGRILAGGTDSSGYFIKVGVPAQYADLVVPKGSVALEGVSLTVADIGTGSLTVRLIPHTLKVTTLQFKKTGDELNIEFDILGKYSRPKKSAITEDFLREKGFC
jgi:riboflavin synthase